MFNDIYKQKIKVLFFAKNYPEFETKYNKLCDNAGQYLRNEYTKHSGNKYTILFWYTNAKQLISAIKKINDIKNNEINELEIITD